jgi:hypothetical protein
VARSVTRREYNRAVGDRLRVLRLVELEDRVDAMGEFLEQRFSRYKHPESFETVAAAPRDDSGKVRRTLLRDERAAWLKENRAFRIFSRAAARQSGLSENQFHVQHHLAELAHAPAKMLTSNVCHFGSTWSGAGRRASCAPNCAE